jgi:hypothetical protein
LEERKVSLFFVVRGKMVIAPWWEILELVLIVATIAWVGHDDRLSY